MSHKKGDWPLYVFFIVAAGAFACLMKATHARIARESNTPEFPPAQAQVATGRGIGAPPPASVSAPATVIDGRSLVREHFVKRGGAHRATLTGSHAAPLLIFDAIDLAWWRESRNGTDPNWRGVGSAGERGEYQIRPIFIEEVKRISGFVIDPLDNDSCRYGIYVYLSYWGPRVGAGTKDDLYELFRRGPTGYRAWKGAE